MTNQQTYQIFPNKWRLNFIIAICIFVFLFTNVLVDFSFTFFQNSSFYISESLLFSSYWLLFLPLLLFVINTTKKTERLALKLLLVSFAVALHLFSYPALVWMISKIFYNHTFDYWQTFNFGLSGYFIQSSIIYGFSFLAFIGSNSKTLTPQLKKEIDGKVKKKDFTTSLLVADSNNKKLLLWVDEILYFSANTPYISIYHSSKKYLHTETLKSLEEQLDCEQFVRIHKSHMVNIHKILSIQSRQNGDYDITLSDHTILRVSRNYAKNFKLKFQHISLP